MKSIFLMIANLLSPSAQSATLRVGDLAPPISLQDQDGKPFNLSSQKGKWTVLFFYPKADTPGCTKQACAFRDSIDLIRKQGAEVFGISADSVSAVKKFHEKYHLKFTLLADPKLDVIERYGVKGILGLISKRWTFILDPELKVRSIDQDVDPIHDAEKSAQKIKELQRN